MVLHELSMLLMQKQMLSKHYKLLAHLLLIYVLRQMLQIGTIQVVQV